MKERNRPVPPPSERVRDSARMQEAMGVAVREALTRHKKLGQAVPVSRNGRVEWIQPEDIPDFELENDNPTS